jgi:hypothetical protein
VCAHIFCPRRKCHGLAPLQLNDGERVAEA